MFPALVASRLAMRAAADFLPSSIARSLLVMGRRLPFTPALTGSSVSDIGPYGCYERWCDGVAVNVRDGGGRVRVDDPCVRWSEFHAFRNESCACS